MKIVRIDLFSFRARALACRLIERTPQRGAAAWQRNLTLLLVASALLSTAAAASDEPVSITKKTQTRTQMHYGDSLGNGQFEQYNTLVEDQVVSITAKVDSVEIKAIQINRGNCAAIITEKLPTSLKFGEALDFSVLCNPIEAKVTTDRGELSVTWPE